MNRIRSRSFILTLSFAAVAALCLSACGGAGGGRLSREAYLQQATSNSIVVVWRTEGNIKPVLRYGDSPDQLINDLKGKAITLRVSVDVDASSSIPRLFKEPTEEVDNREADHDPSTAPNTYQFEALVTDLEPNSKYYYAIYDGNRLLEGGDNDHYFVTHRPIGSPTDMRLWVVGDSGTGGNDQARVHEAMREFVNQSGRNIDHYIHVGDMAYGDGTDQQFSDNFFAPYKDTLRNTVCWPAMGNHEGHTSRGISGTGPYYDAYVVPTRAEVGGVASGTEAYYSFDIDEVHFICLDSHDLDRSPNAAMAQWLRADLEQAKAKWMIAFWHHPPYTKGSHNSDTESQLVEMRENFMPILESGGVDLTLTGHSHIYERSMLIDGAYHTPTIAEGVVLDDGDGNPNGDGAYRKSMGLHPHEGSVSIVAGHGGASLARLGTMPVMREIIVEHGSVILDIHGDTLKGTMVNKNGDTRDIFSIVKRGKVVPARIQNPWQPGHDDALLTRLTVKFDQASVGAAPAGWKVVSGNSTGLVVAADQRGKEIFLRARADDSPLIGLFDRWETDKVDYIATVRLPDSKDKGVGMVFGYQDVKNFGLVFFDAGAGVLRVSRVSDGNEKVLEEEEAKNLRGQWLLLDVRVADGGVVVKFQDKEKKQPQVRFSANLQASGGPFGFYIPTDSSAEFLQIYLRNRGL